MAALQLRGLTYLTPSPVMTGLPWINDLDDFVVTAAQVLCLVHGLARLMPNRTVAIEAAALQVPQRCRSPESMVWADTEGFRAILIDRQRTELLAPFEANKFAANVDEIFIAAEAVDHDPAGLLAGLQPTIWHLDGKLA